MNFSFAIIKQLNYNCVTIKTKANEILVLSVLSKKSISFDHKNIIKFPFEIF